METCVNPRDVVLLTGPIFIATAFNWALLGVLVLQVYIFYIYYPKERLGIKALVYTLLVLDLIQSAFTSHYSWFILISGWGDSTHLIELPWSASTIPVMCGIISSIVQIYFAWRIWVLMAGSRLAMYITVLIILVALVQSITATVVSILFATSKANLTEIPDFVVGVGTWLAGSFVCDVLIAGTMVTILEQARRESLWGQSETLLTKLIINTVETGAITALIAGMQLIFYLLFRERYFQQVPGFILGKLYSNVVLATLNSRLHRSYFGSNIFGSTTFYEGTRTGPHEARDGHGVRVPLTLHADFNI